MFGLSRERVEELKREWVPGTRVVCITMDGEPRYEGRHGTVGSVDDAGQVHVAWDQGGSLALIYGEDEWRREDTRNGE